MGKSLVIVESPAKAKTIGKYLGKDFIVKSSIGHIRDLPVSGGKKQPANKEDRNKSSKKKLSAEMRARERERKVQQQLVSRMGIDPDNDWAANYEILPGKEKVVDELRRIANQADHVFLATDLDREGEAIAWHLMEAIGENVARFHRVTFNEITKTAIQEAFKAPGELNLARVNAQQARRFLDRVVGYMVSPLLWSKVARGLSAGRVQSVAVRLIVERERDIRKFVPEEYWEIYADIQTTEGLAITLQVARENEKAFKPTCREQTDKALASLEAHPYQVKNCEEKLSTVKPTAPYITSTLQQAASTRLGFSVRKTMMMAQRLYEAGYITYMRTDSTNLSKTAIDNVRTYIKKTMVDVYLPEKPNIYASKSGAQEAHEAIRPSEVAITTDKLKAVERDAERLYELIWRQFVAGQMMPAQYKNKVITVGCGSFELRCKGRSLVFDGFTIIHPPIGKKEDTLLPEVRKGDDLQLKKLIPKQLFTKPPGRYSEAALVKELEKQGIGRPSTYASIISTIQDRGYVTVKQRRFFAEKIGDIVTDRLLENFSELMDYSFTARMEEELDVVAGGAKNWLDLLDSFYADFTLKLRQAQNSDSGMRTNQPVMTNIHCKMCQRPMQIRTGSTGVFLGCSGYSLPIKERCKETMNLVPGEEEAITADDEMAEVNALRAMHRCSKCGTAMESYLIDETRKLHVCGNSPDCSGYDVEIGHFQIKGYEGPTLECDKCTSEMQLKSGRFGKYFGCTNANCKNTRKLLKSGQPAPPKMDPVPMPELKCIKVDDTYILRDGASGLFLAASQFPKNRETRAPLVLELIPHKDEIDSKYNYLMSAPTVDHDGNPAIVRYSRKMNEQYVMSENEGKATGWQAYFDEEGWREKVPVRKKTKKQSSSRKKTTAKASTTKKKSAKKLS